MKRASASLGIVLLFVSLGQASEHETMYDLCADDREPAVFARSLKLLTLNASHGRNTAINQVLVGKQRTYENLDVIAGLLTIAAADVVALQEADAASRWSGGFNHVEYIAERANYSCVIRGLHSRSWISTYGTALL